MDSSAEFVPRDVLVTALRRWWVIALAVLVGGLAGLGLHALRPTVFEARFEVLLGLDQVGSGELERFEEDAALDAAGLILGGPETLQQVAEAARQAGIEVQPEDLAQMATLERRRTAWMVRLRGPDPQRLEALASVWLQTGFSALEEAYVHARRADSVRRALVQPGGHAWHAQPTAAPPKDCAGRETWPNCKLKFSAPATCWLKSSKARAAW